MRITLKLITLPLRWTCGAQEVFPLAPTTEAAHSLLLHRKCPACLCHSISSSRTRTRQQKPVRRVRAF